MRLGVRVVRGPQWKWNEQDGGDGFVGTVVELPATAPKTCLVQWDSKPMMNYRAGLCSRFDLRVFDSAPSGVKHDYPCTGCNDRVICGILWACAECSHVFLCTFCYMNDKHNLDHSFRRIYHSHSVAIMVPPRLNSRKLDSYGVFEGATVKRGRDWSWDNQDCDGLGTVTSLQGWSEESSRSVVCVVWQNRTSNVYRMGHRGKTDLFAIKPAKGWPYYVDHLPNFGEEMVEGRLPIFTVGETVKVDSNIVRVKKLSDGHGQWHENMKNYIGVIGVVHRITESDDVRIIFSDRQKWTYNPKAITKIFRENDKVMLTSDLETLKEYHGDALNSFAKLRGAHGTVVDIRPEGNLYHVSFIGGVNVYVHVNCLYAVDTASRNVNSLLDDQIANTGLVGSSWAPPGAVQQQMVPMIGFNVSQGVAFTPECVAQFFQALEQRDAEKARKMLSECHDLANSEFNGRKALFCAVASENPEILRLLVRHGADVSTRDANGDTVVHLAVKSEIWPLIPVFADQVWQSAINTLNGDYDTPLHLCIKKGSLDAVKCMLTFSNIQGSAKDGDGNLPLHAAILSNKNDIVDSLLDCRAINPSLANDDGHNALHLACMQGKTRLIEKILRLRPDLINASNKKGFAPVHLVVFHNHLDALRCILNQQFVHINARVMRNHTFNSYTALHLAVHKMHAKCVEVLVDVGQVELSLPEDSNLMTPLHLAVDALIKMGHSLTPENLFVLQQLDPNEFCMDTLIERCSRCLPLAVCCYLIANNAELHAKNKSQMTPVDLLMKDPVCKCLMPTFHAFCMLKSGSNRAQQTAATSAIGRSSSNSNTANFSSTSNTNSSVSAAFDSNSGKASPVTTSSRKMIMAEGESCRTCGEIKANVRFEPCNHILLCLRCVHKMCAANIEWKKCIVCNLDIKAKVGPEGEIKSQPKTDANSTDINCPVCMERVKNVAPRCGHTLCRQCANSVNDCPICRAPMVDIRPIYL